MAEMAQSSHRQKAAKGGGGGGGTLAAGERDSSLLMLASVFWRRSVCSLRSSGVAKWSWCLARQIVLFSTPARQLGSGNVSARRILLPLL